MILLKFIFNLINHIGINIRHVFAFFGGLPYYVKTFCSLKKQYYKSDRLFPIKVSMPILYDRFDNGGSMQGHYFHQDLFVAQHIFMSNPIRHIDIGSRVDGFVAHVASFRQIDIIDIRPLNSNVKNIFTQQADLMQLPENMVHCTDSLSCLHAIEHFGLGRYNDPIDYNGHIKALENMYNMLKPNGLFYFSTPIGPQRIEFNAHRVFSIKYLLDLFKDKYMLNNFSYVDDKGDIHINIILNEKLISNNLDCNYGCGIFELIKK
jgi:SAM-dependent methyltransferase